MLLFGLPGNPVSSFVTFELFVRPVIRLMAGHADLGGRTIVRARLADVARSDPGRRAFLRVALTRDPQGQWTASLAGGQGSHMLSGLAAADGLAIVPEGIGELEAGAEVDVIRLEQGNGSLASTRHDRGARPFEPTARKDRRRLSHIDRRGRPRMVDVTAKPATPRRAIAEARVRMAQETLSLVIDGAGPKGDVMSVAELAGVMAAKRTSDLIPLCHPIALTDLGVEITPDRVEGLLRIRATAATVGPTGVEMEALTAATIAALTVYDMVKGVDRFAEIVSVRLLEKSGGKSGEWRRPADDAPEGPRPRVPKGSRGPRRAG